MPDATPDWILDGDDVAVSVWFAACSAAFYVTAEPHASPYCGGGEVSPGYAVAIRPE